MTDPAAAALLALGALCLVARLVRRVVDATDAGRGWGRGRGQTDHEGWREG
jgi:hypothetical protein